MPAISAARLSTGSVIDAGPDEPNLRAVRVLERDDGRDEDPEWFQMLVVERA